MNSSALAMPAAKAEIRRSELRQVLAQACELTVSEAADALLIPGDLFDDEAITFDDLGHVVEQFGHMNRPVVIAPGNHDYVSPASMYEPEVLAARHHLQWPANVHIFQKQAWETHYLGGATITGLGFQTHVPLDEHLLKRVPRPESSRLHVLLFHGSRLASVPAGKLMTLPFSDEELAETGCDYAAIGHYHDFTRIEAGGRTIGAYSGCPAGRGIDECGAKVVLKGEVSDEGHVSIDPVQLDRRRVMRVSVDCSGCQSNESIQSAVEARLATAGCTPDDIVRVELEGEIPPSLALHLPEGFLEERFFHRQIDGSHLRPAYDLAQYVEDGPASDTTQGRFVQRLLAQLRDAEDGGDGSRAETLRRAIEYGLDSLRGDKVHPRGMD